MDLSHTQSSLSLGFHAYQSQIPDDSTSLQSDVTLCQDSRRAWPLALQLFDQQSEARQGGSFGIDDGEDSNDGQKEEEFSLLGYPMNVKRQRRGDSLFSCSSSSSLHPSKRAAVEPDLETRRATVRSWGNQTLSVADPDLHEIIENERQRQIKGIELIAS